MSEHQAQGRLVVNQVVVAELAVRGSSQSDIDAWLPLHQFARESVPWEAAFLAGQAFAGYRRRGGPRLLPLPDFFIFIGAHAVVGGYTLITRDPRTFRTYFPSLDVASPG